MPPPFRLSGRYILKPRAVAIDLAMGYSVQDDQGDDQSVNHRDSIIARPISMVTVFFPEASGTGRCLHRALHGHALADASTEGGNADT